MVWVGRWVYRYSRIAPDNVDKLSDCEDINENILEYTTTNDVPNQFEIHLPKPERKRHKNLQSVWKKVDFPKLSFESQHANDILFKTEWKKI